MKRWIPILTLAAGMIVILAALPASAQEGGEGEPDEFAARRGAAVFAEFCQACHGPTGEAIASGPAFAAITYDAATAREVIVNGKDSDTADGVAMPPYGLVLDQTQMDDLIAYLDTWGTGATPPLPEPNIGDVPEQVPDHFGDPHEGGILYAKFCNGCHGPEGAGRLKPIGRLEVTRQTARLIAESTESVYMPGFGAAAGGPLSDAQITDIETYMASWEFTKAVKEPESRGYNVLIVLTGAVAILAVGAIHLARVRGGGDEPAA
jgi:mono/diheme cytochrome c family protein